MLYEKIFGKRLPENTLVLPLFYHTISNQNSCLLFAREKQHSPGANSQEILLIDVVGKPTPEIVYLKGQFLKLYRTTRDSENFLMQLRSKTKEQEKLLTKTAEEFEVLVGHSIATDLSKISPDNYISLHRENALDISPSSQSLWKILQNATPRTLFPDEIRTLISEITSRNRLIQDPFLVCCLKKCLRRESGKSNLLKTTSRVPFLSNQEEKTRITRSWEKFSTRRRNHSPTQSFKLSEPQSSEKKSSSSSWQENQKKTPPRENRNKLSTRKLEKKVSRRSNVTKRWDFYQDIYSSGHNPTPNPAPPPPSTPPSTPPSPPSSSPPPSKTQLPGQLKKLTENTNPSISSIIDLDLGLKGEGKEAAQEIINLVENRLGNVHAFFKTHPTFYRILLGKISRSILRGQQKEETDSTQYFLNFMQKAEKVFSDPELEMNIFRQTQKLLPSNISRIFERIAPVEIKHHFRSAPKTEQKCRNLVKKNLVEVAKMRFLCQFDPNLDIANCLPLDDNFLEYIRKYDQESCFCSEQEVAIKYSQTIKKMV